MITSSPSSDIQASINRFISDVKQILADEGPSEPGIQQLINRMRVLVKDPVILESHQQFINAVNDVSKHDYFVDRGRKSIILYTDETGLTLVRSRFDPGEPTPIHSHSTWGIVGVYAGRDRHQAWRRVDGGRGPGHAELELIEERVLETGDVVTIPHPPQDIHAQQGYDGEAAYELVLFGANAMMIPRLIFDPEQQTAREVIPATPAPH
jgi:predicted metal-dependent enzyme (double-stranded beta helix superfamily)